MPRFLCAAKREIKETVISSAASAADSCIAVTEWVCEAMRGAKGCKGEKKNMEGGMGRRRRRMGQQTVGSTVIQGFTAVRSSLEGEHERTVGV